MSIGTTPQRNLAMALRIRGALVCLTYISGATGFQTMYIFSIYLGHFPV